MPLTKLLIKLAMKVLERVLNVINQQINRVQNEVIDQIDGIVFRGMDDFWRGEDAEMFKADVSRALQEAAEVVGLARGTYQGLERARDRIIQADQKAASVVSDLQQIFGKISSI
jgi:uncharacterized protein YukE